MNEQGVSEIVSVPYPQGNCIHGSYLFNIIIKKIKYRYCPVFWMFWLIILSSGTGLAAQVQLAWDANTEPDLAGYRVFSHRTNGSYDYSSPTWSGTENSCTLENLDEGSGYYFVVRAFNTAGVESGDSNEAYYSVPQSQNTPPIANAGSDCIIPEGDPVALDGSVSGDPDGTIVMYHWVQIPYSTVILSDAAAVKPDFTAPQVSSAGAILTFQLTVTDNGGLTNSDTVSISVNDLVSVDSDGDGIGNSQDPDDDNDGMPDIWEIEYGLDPLNADDGQDVDGDGFTNLVEYLYQTSPTDNSSIPPQTPVAIAGFDQTVTEGTTVTLNGSASYDSAGAIVVYGWVQTGGTEIVLSDESAVAPTFVPPPVSDDDVVLTFNLKVTDEDGFEDIDSIDVIVRDNNITGFPDDVITFYSIDDQPMAVQIHDGGYLVRLETVDPDFVGDAGDRPEFLPYGLIDMDVKASNPGGSVILTVYLPEGASEDAVWYNYNDATGWQDYSRNSDFNAARDQVTLVLTDGGAGDNDRQVNSMILDPSGLGFSSLASDDDPVASTSDGGSGGCFIGTAGTKTVSTHGYPAGWILMVLVAACAFRRTFLRQR
jgi:hypothetical protein